MSDVKQRITQEKRLELLFKNIRMKLQKESLLVNEEGFIRELNKTNRLSNDVNNPMIQVKEAKVKFTTPVLEEVVALSRYLSAIQQTFMKTVGKTFYLDPVIGEMNLTFYLNPYFIRALEQEEVVLYQQTVSHFNQLLTLVEPLLKQKLQGAVVSQGGEIGLEIKGLSLDPTSSIGITKTRLHFLRLLFLYSQYQAEVKEESLDELLVNLLEMVERIHGEGQDKALLLRSLETAQIIEPFVGDSLQVMHEYHQSWWENPFLLIGYGEMELSTQLMLSEAIKQGIEFEVIDSNDQVIKLTKNQQVEYVKNTNMTSKDTYIASLIMENKTATKEVLRKQGFHVPYGKEFSNVEEALLAYEAFSDLSVVVKPKTTNFGLGISIFQEDFLKEDFAEALRIAFAEDSYVLVEEFMPGTEYRFYVLDGQVEGIILRVAANVKGDGVHTIEELVALKNQDPLRGTRYRRPLQKIILGDIERLMLKTQGYQVSDVLEKDQIVYLRENSNVSTGGDSIDMTDEMHTSYKKIAAEAVEALGVFVSGIDLMIPDYQKPAKRLSSDYGIIEANFNPAIHMHMYPYEGQGRPLAGLMLEKLFS